MPKYAYACKDCGVNFEVSQSFTDSAITQCPTCNGKVRKLYNQVGIVFKGDGFYRTDSREKTKTSKTTTTDTPKANTDKPASSNTETKNSSPATTTKTQTSQTNTKSTNN